MKVMYGNRVNVLMVANMLHVRFVGRNCPVEAVQHIMCSGNTCVYGTHRRPLVPMNRQRQEQILSLYKQTNVYNNVIEISVILVKQSLYDCLQAF